ncbi:hypothetical protein OPV22_002995 [Ensete ventricosum]|uniref:Rx N-terminal domain-containing protein n=1 Tax=Ensete ventricosum TaxID=4639 RepID=A0AAV8RZL5_ENSVE|nr:hypothetical protein OPV22_002995 [Ensete ventricosum]RZR93833.1 hypothetical protein BHM03_00022411 [Ensete ventricosum]
MESMRKLLVEKAGELKGVDELKESVVELLKEKLAQLIHVLQDAIRFLAEKLDLVFPPETRAETLHRWLHVGLTVVLPVAVVLLCLYCCCCRGNRCCCGVGRRGTGRMMRAPGRHGAFMPRASFESDPRGYFINLRAKNDLVF